MYSGYYDDDNIDIDIDGCDSNGNRVSVWGRESRYDNECDYHDYSTVDSNVKTRVIESSSNTVTPMFKFYSVEELVTSDIFQKQLGMALEHKDKIIKELQFEILQQMKSGNAPLISSCIDTWEVLETNDIVFTLKSDGTILEF